MCTRTSTKTSTLMATYAGFADAAGMPEPFSVRFEPNELSIDIQPGADPFDPVAVLSALVLWTRNLSGITAHWRRDRDERLLMTVTGRTNNGVSITVFDAIDYRAAEQLVYLEPGERESVTPDELSFLASEIQAAPSAERT